MMKNYLKAISFNKYALNFPTLSIKYFTVEGKLKTQDPNTKHKHFTLNYLFQNEKTGENNSFQQFSYNQIPDDFIKEEKLENLEIDEKINEVPNIKKQVEQPIVNTEKVSKKESMNYNKQKEITYKQVMSKSYEHEDLIDKMLSQKANNSHNTNNNTYQKNQNIQNTTNNHSPQKRHKINLIREGMILCLYLKKPSNQQVSGKNDGYVFIDLKEYTENYYEDKKAKDPRFIILNPIQCAKFHLLDPRTYNQNDPQKISISQKNRIIEIDQNKDKTFTFSMVIRTDANELSEITNEIPNQIISRIELNPEDIIIIQRFINVS